MQISRIPADDDKELIDRLLEFLRRAHPIKTADHVSAATGISPSTIQRWLERGSFPSGPALLLLLRYYKAPLLAALYKSAPDWVREASVQHRVGEIRTEIERLVSELNALNAELAQK